MEEDYQQKLIRYKLEDKQRELNHQNRLSKIETQRRMSPIINILFYQGKIDQDEYMKWILDETCEYQPKINM